MSTANFEAALRRGLAGSSPTLAADDLKRIVAEADAALVSVTGGKVRLAVEEKYGTTRIFADWREVFPDGYAHMRHDELFDFEFATTREYDRRPVTGYPITSDEGYGGYYSDKKTTHPIRNRAELEAAFVALFEGATFAYNVGEALKAP